MTPKSLRKIALYLKYIAFVLEEDADEGDGRRKPKDNGSKLRARSERNRHISEGMKLAWARRRKEKVAPCQP